MEDFLLIVVLVVLFVRWLILSGRMAEMKRRIEELSSEETRAALTRRVYALEQEVKELRAARLSDVVAAPPPVEPKTEPEPAPEPAKAEPEPVHITPPPVVPEPEAPRVWEPVTIPAPPVTEREPEPVPPPPPIFTPQPAQ